MQKRKWRYQIHFSIIVNQNAARHSFSSCQRETRGSCSLEHNSIHHVAHRWAPGESVVRLYAFMHASTHIKPLKHRKDIFLTVENKLGQIEREKEKEDDRMLWQITKTHCVCMYYFPRKIFTYTLNDSLFHTEIFYDYYFNEQDTKIYCDLFYSNYLTIIKK